MKKLRNNLIKIIRFSMICFAGCTIAFIIRAIAQKSSTISIDNLIQLMEISIIGAFIERIFYSESILKKLSYFQRTILFLFVMTCVVSIYVIKFKWVETTVTGILIRFFIAFSIGIITNTCIEKFLTKEGEKYTKILNEYKNRNKKIDE